MIVRSARGDRVSGADALDLARRDPCVCRSSIDKPVVEPGAIAALVGFDAIARRCVVLQKAAA